MATTKKIVTEAVYEDLFAELLATVRVPEDLKVTADIVLSCPTKTQVTALSLATDEVDAQRIIFGNAYEAAQELFNDKPLMIWNAFMEKYNAHFFPETDSGK